MLEHVGTANAFVPGMSWTTVRASRVVLEPNSFKSAERPGATKLVSRCEQCGQQNLEHITIAQGTGFVSKEDLPESEDDEEDEIEARTAKEYAKVAI